MEAEEYDYYQQMNQDRANKQAGFSSPVNPYGSSIIMLTNPDNELYKLELALRGLALDEKGTPIKIGDPLMTNEGVNSIISQTRACVSQVAILSNLDDKQILAILDFLGDTIIKDLMINHKKYNCNSLVIRDKIHNLVLTTAFICMRRAFNEGDRRFWKNSLQEITTRVESGQAPGKKNLFSNILGWGKK